MTNQSASTYLPDYVVAPGEILEEYLESLQMTQADLAQRAGLTPKTINAIIKGKSPIVPETALKFEKILGRPAHFWNALETQYQENIVRLKEKQQLHADLEWASRFPYTEMVKRNLVPAEKDKVERVTNLLRFFGVASSATWKDIWEDKLKHVDFRQSAQALSFEAVTVWLRQGELEAQKIQVPAYDEKKFREVLTKIRDLTILSPNEFLPKLHELFNSAGVKFVLVPELPKAGVFGATRWINGNPLMQICLHGKSNDNFWFSIFHESAHILKHGRKELFIVGKKFNSDKEQEANTWARNFLVPTDKMKEFLAKGKPTLSRIKDFAGQMGIHAGIIVGRLQHDKVLAPSIGNKMKISFKWKQSTQG